MGLQRSPANSHAIAIEGCWSAAARLAKYGLAPESVVGQAFTLRSDELEKMERMLTSAERRRNAIVRELQA
jgi:hypothetical protein